MNSSGQWVGTILSKRACRVRSCHLPEKVASMSTSHTGRTPGTKYHSSSRRANPSRLRGLRSRACQSKYTEVPFWPLSRHSNRRVSRLHPSGGTRWHFLNRDGGCSEHVVPSVLLPSQ